MKPRILHLMTMPGICCAPCMSTSNGSVFCTPNECCLQSCCVLSNISMEKLVKLMLTKPELKISATTEMINASIGMADAGCCELWKLGRCYCIRNRVWLSHGQLLWCKSSGVLLLIHSCSQLDCGFDTSYI
jgi:hypothetical protein